jgi:hypothetical protein
MPWNGFYIGFLYPGINRYILKGALMLRIWEAPQIRPTMDIDMLGKPSNKLSYVVSNVIDILSVDVDPDGLSFLLKKYPPSTLQMKLNIRALEFDFQQSLIQ